MRIDSQITNFLVGTVALGFCLWLISCSGPIRNETPAAPTTAPAPMTPPTQPAPSTDIPTSTSEPDSDSESEPLADVVSVDVSGSENDYRFSVGVASPDTGCDQYANWWEVVSADGELIYRRILLHPHEAEQPFVRSGGPVAVAADAVVIVRAHMHPTGYGGHVMRGSVSDGFTTEAGDPNFAVGLANEPPEPEGCDF
ncbi:MAG: hypothetical protein ACP5JG_16335 [Anaerolineae bacterium]